MEPPSNPGRIIARKLRAALKARDDNVHMPRGQETVARFLKEWLVTSRASLRPQTWITYERHLRLHAVPFIGRVRLAELDRGHLDRLYHQRLAAGLSPTTVRHVHAILHRALEQALRWGAIARNVADLVDPPRRAQRDMRPLDAVQVRGLLDAARGDRLEALFVLAVTTGMRRGELLALKWRGVDLDGASLSVTGTLHQTRAGLRVAEPKTARSRRRIDLTPTAVAALRRHRAVQLEERLLAGTMWEDGDFVFTNAMGRPVDPGNLLHRQFAPLLTRADLPRMRFHDLRHTAATLMLTRGVHPKIVAEMLGHATIAITLDTYSHVLPTMQEAAARAMEDVLTGR